MNYRTKQRIFEKKIAPEYEHIYYFICSRVQGDTHLARDITQDVMESIWDKLGQLQNEAALKSWILKIILNEIRKYFRGLQAQKRSLFFEESMDRPEEEFEVPDESQPDILDLIIAKEEREVLMKAISRIPDPYRTILELRLIYDYPFHEIAESLPLKEGTTRVYFCRAVEMLAEEYHKLTKGDEDDANGI